MTSQHQALLGLTIQKSTDSRQPVTTALAVDIDGVGRVDIDLDEHTFVHLLGASNVQIQAHVDFAPTASQQAEAATARDLLIEAFDSLPAGHKDRAGLRRAVEILNHQAVR